MKKTEFICRGCNILFPREMASLDKRGYMRGSRCRPCQGAYYAELSASQGKQIYRRAYVAFKKDQCEKCGFKGVPCQLDVDHINGDHSDNRPENLQTLCANCHRYKTFISKEGIHK